MSLQIIAAMTPERVIGNEGKIPWRIPEDLNLFKVLTTGNTVIMGKNTWLSIPAKFRPLPDRTNIVVSRTLASADGAIVCKSLDEARAIADKRSEKVFCIGGAQLYAAALPFTDTMHLSWVKKEYSGDTKFPAVNFGLWKEVESKDFADFVYKKYTVMRH